MAKNNFAVKMIPAGNWRRIEGTTPTGGDDEARPHIVPLTDDAERHISIDAWGGIGSSGLTPGEITEDGGKTWKLAYRFLADANLTNLEALLPDLENELAEKTKPKRSWLRRLVR